MSFIYPGFLYALLAVLIPIIIHLFNFRKFKTVYFSNVAFLKNIKQETKSKSQLKHWLILLARILAIVALVFAFAQPFFPANKTKETQAGVVGIYVDNSFSAEGESANGKLIDLQKNKVLRIIDAYPETQKFVYLTNSLSSKHRHLVNKEQLKEFSAETNFSPQTRQISQVLSQLENFVAEKKTDKADIYIVSDFQKSISDFKALENDTAFRIKLIPLSPQVESNLFIDSVWFEKPNRPLNMSDELFVRIVNLSDEAYTSIPLKLYLNDTLKTPASFNIEANSVAIEKIAFTNSSTGIIRGRAEITDYPITYDNVFFFDFYAAKSRKVISIAGNKKNKFIHTLFENQNYFKISNVLEQNVKVSELRGADVLILDAAKNPSSGLRQELTSFVSSGGTLIVFPAFNGHHESYNELFSAMNINQITGKDSTKVLLDKINYKANLFQNVFKIQDKNAAFPFANHYLKFSNFTTANEEALISSEKNDKIATRYEFGRGQVYLFAQEASEKAGDLVYHPLWAPVLYNMALFGNEKRTIYQTIGALTKTEVFAGKHLKDKVLHIVNSEGTSDFIPRYSKSGDGRLAVFAGENIKQAGNYTITAENEPLQGISFNYNRKESEIDFYTKGELQQQLEKFGLTSFEILDKEKSFLTQAIKTTSGGTVLWKYFIWAVLIFLAFEILLVRIK